MTPFRLAWLNLFRRPLSTWISIFGIALAVASAGVLLKIYLLSQSRFNTMAREGQSVVGAKAGGVEILLGALNLEGAVPGFLPYNLYKSIEAQQTVKFEDGAETKPSYVTAVLPFLWFATSLDARVIGTSPTFIHRPVDDGAPSIASGTWNTAAGDVVLGSQVAADRGLKIGDTVQATTSIGVPSRELRLHVVGLLKETGKIWDHAMFTSIEDAQAALASVDLKGLSIWGPNVLHYFLLYHDARGFPSLRSLIDQRTVGQLISIDEQVEHLQKLTGTGRAFGLLLTALILFLSSSSVASMMVTRFDSMSTQLAILRAIGYERAEIALWLFFEGLILGGIACAIGAVMDFALFPWIRNLSGLDLPAFVPNPVWSSAWIWFAAMIVTLLAVLVPMLRLYRQDVNASLKA